LPAFLEPSLASPNPQHREDRTRLILKTLEFAKQVRAKNISITSGNKWRGTVFVGNTNITVTDTGTPSTTAWSHLVMTKAGSTLTLYVNGAAVATTTVAGIVNTSTGILAIGRTGGSSTDYFNGQIDEVAVYPIALPAARIYAHYAAGVSGPG